MKRASLLLLPAVASLGLFAGGPVAQAAASSNALSHRPAIMITRTNAGWSSGNWSGYAGTTGGPGSATSVKGTWKVPKVSATSGNSYSSSWLGIDGFGNTSLIQTGTEQDWVGGAPLYRAWWEILPAAETIIPSLTIKPGDLMSAQIQHTSGASWTIKLKDVTSGQSFTTTKSYSGPADTAEWIQEAPSTGRDRPSAGPLQQDVFRQGWIQRVARGSHARQPGRDDPERCPGVDALQARLGPRRVRHRLRIQDAGAQSQLGPGP